MKRCISPNCYHKAIIQMEFADCDNVNKTFNFCKTHALEWFIVLYESLGTHIKMIRVSKNE